MRVFVCEFVTGGGMADRPLPAGLHREGDMMLGAVVKDLALLDGVEVATTRDARLPRSDLPARTHRIDPASDPWLVWRQWIAEADAVWPIAPETGGILERLSNLVLAGRRILLGSRPAAVRLAASKRETAAVLQAAGIATVFTMPLDTAPASGPPPSECGWVVKPDDGAGAEDTFVFASPDALRRWSDGRPDLDRFVVQPFLPGVAASLSLLCCRGRAMLLSCNSQDIRRHGDRLRYHGGMVGCYEGRRQAYEPLAARVAEAIPELWGHVGIDLLETADGPVVIEVNPRVTTSYAGLRASLGVNPAALLLSLLHGGPAAIHRFRHSPVRVEADAA